MLGVAADAEGAKKRIMVKLLKMYDGVSFPLADAEGAKTRSMVELLKMYDGVSFGPVCVHMHNSVVKTGNKKVLWKLTISSFTILKQISIKQ